MKKGFDFKTIDRTTDICNVLGDIIAKAGISIRKGPVLDIILDVTKIILNKPNLEDFIRDEKRKLKQKGMSNRKIELLQEKGAFEKKYDSTIKINNYSTIGARLLIEIQTSPQPYTITEDKGICIFNGFDGKNGLTFFSCILSKILKKSQKDIMEKLEEVYDNYKKYSYIEELYKKKKEKNEISKAKNDVFITENKEVKYSEPKNVNIKSEKDVFHKINNQTQKLKEFVGQVIKSAPTNDPQTMLPENSCCNEDAIKFIDYFNYINNNLDEKEDIYKLILENKNLSNIFELFLNSGAYHKIYLKSNKRQRTNKNVIPLPETVDNRLITEKFVQYIGSGQFKGTKDIILRVRII